MDSVSSGSVSIGSPLYLSIPLYGFGLKASADSMNIGDYLSIPLYGFPTPPRIYYATVAELPLSIPLYGFLPRIHYPVRCAARPPFQFHCMDSIPGARVLGARRVYLSIPLYGFCENHVAYGRGWGSFNSIVWIPGAQLCSRAHTLAFNSIVWIPRSSPHSPRGAGSSFQFHCMDSYCD